MNIIVEKGIPAQAIWEIAKTFKQVGFSPKLFEVTFNKQKMPISEIECIIQNFCSGKNIIVTTRMINGERQLGLNFDYYGVANSLNGNLAVVTLNSQTENKIGLVSLHEYLHLLGITHCRTHGCVMAFKLCGHQLRYCLNCPHPCANINLCQTCQGELNARAAREN